MAELILTDANFGAEVIEAGTLTLVDFWAPWCGPCQMMGPIVDQLAEEYAGQGVKVGKVNVDENPNTAGKYQVMSIPTFLVFKGGQVVDQLVGGMQKEALKEVIEKHK
ncbi:thioredoxin [Patescibacteria group bacterium]|nr:thioredoxin [Patescibacteria group bacterium]MBU1721941.1 thioredoxin [Patescibacteria group bacterium]MBU1901787.1 thioredoxin [Patescibacteria group bacterium]